ncbi:MAG: cadmium-translocating P-type ATPase [Rhodobacteraceae bacterium]|nr:cadmium-translocating P-type ATPase [Paracoccaceae bacterium]
MAQRIATPSPLPLRTDCKVPATPDHTGLAACPPAGAVAAPPVCGQLILALPGVHCAGCISGVERALRATPGVREARVNLTLKRVTVQAGGNVTAATLIKVLERAGYAARELDPGVLATVEHDRRGRDLLMRLAVAFFAMMNVMLLSVAVWSGAQGATRDMMHWISAAIAIPAVIFCGRPFYASAWSALRVRRLNMDVPITLAILLAVATSLYETAHSGHHAYFDAAVTLCFFLLAGRYLDHRTRASARSAAQELAALEVPRALRLTPRGEEVVAVRVLAPGDLVRVKPGGRIPVDGRVVEGQSEVDRALMTGESLPAFAGPGSRVSAGEVNLTGSLTIQVTATGDDTALHRIADLVAVAEAGRNNYTSLADQAAKLYAPGVHILALLAAIGWWVYTLDVRVSLNIAAAVLIITCPCALGLAVPAVTTAASGRLFRRGVLIKDGTAMERLAEVDTVVFDKTGTLTLGAPEPADLDRHAPRTLRVALGLAQASAHPLAESLAQALCKRGIRPARLAGVTETPGYGVQALWHGQPVRLGRAAWVGAPPPDVTATCLRIGDAAPVTFPFIDSPRPGAAQVIAALKTAGKHLILISGDAQGAVARFAGDMGLTEVIAQATPQQKARVMAELSEQGARVLMVGDGLNDTAALAAAHVSIAPATALAAARAASDMVLLGRDLSPLVQVLTTATRARTRIQENFIMATAYNVLAVPVAIAGLATPLVAALAMSASSLAVSLNALRVK